MCSSNHLPPNCSQKKKTGFIRERDGSHVLKPKSDRRNPSSRKKRNKLKRELLALWNLFFSYRCYSSLPYRPSQKPSESSPVSGSGQGWPKASSQAKTIWKCGHWSYYQSRARCSFAWLHFTSLHTCMQSSAVQGRLALLASAATARRKEWLGSG